MDVFWLIIYRTDVSNIFTIILHTFDDLRNFLEFGNWKSGNLEISRNGMVWTKFDILGIYPTQFRSLSLIVKSDFQNSNFSGIWPENFWKSGNSQKWAGYDQFCHFGYISHSV